MSRFCFILYSLVILTLMTLVSDFLFIWIIYELSLFISLILINNKKTSQAVALYFLIQSAGTTCFVFGVILSYPMVMVLGLFMKMGAAPMHFWVPLATSALSWGGLFILLGYQKLFPMIVLIFTPNLNPQLILITGLLSATLGSFGGLGFSNMKLIISFSSISHIGWLVAASTLSQQLALFYMCIYIITLAPLAYTLHTSTQDSHCSKPLIMLLLSLGGVPPLPGFLSKMITLKYLAVTSSTTLILMFLLTNIITLIFYTKMVLALTFTATPQKATPFFTGIVIMLMALLFMSMVLDLVF